MKHYDSVLFPGQLIHIDAFKKAKLLTKKSN